MSNVHFFHILLLQPMQSALTWSYTARKLTYISFFRECHGSPVCGQCPGPQHCCSHAHSVLVSLDTMLASFGPFLQGYKEKNCLFGLWMVVLQTTGVPKVYIYHLRNLMFEDKKSQKQLFSICSVCPQQCWSYN